jgi:hypothetical protein
MPLPPQPLTDDQRRRACVLLALGSTRLQAAHFADCRLKDLEAEIQRDPAFKIQVHQSELRPEIEILRTLREAARDPKQWRAGAWALERFYPRRYGLRKRNTLTKAEKRRFTQRRKKKARIQNFPLSQNDAAGSDDAEDDSIDQ